MKCIEFTQAESRQLPDRHPDEGRDRDVFSIQHLFFQNRFVLIQKNNLSNS